MVPCLHVHQRCTAFINNSLTDKGLVHCVSVARAKLFIYEPYLEGPFLTFKTSCSPSPIEHFIRYDDGITPLDGNAEKPPAPVSKPLAKKV